MDLKYQAIELICSNQTASKDNKQPSAKKQLPDIASSIDLDAEYCRICQRAESPINSRVELISPCYCSGSLRWVHHSCLQKWLHVTNYDKCEICQYNYTIGIKYNPMNKWQTLKFRPVDYKELIYNGAFNLGVIICLFLTSYVLIRQALSEKEKISDCSFQPKIGVAGIGLFFGWLVSYVQILIYYSMFKKWRKLNRIIIIENAKLPENKNQSFSKQERSDDEDVKNIVPKVDTTDSIPIGT